MIKERVSDLPQFTPEQSELLKQSVDFLGLNHYNTKLVSDLDDPSEAHDYLARYSMTKQESDPSWEKTSMGWSVVPWGLSKLLAYIHNRYPQWKLYVTENGCGNFANSIEESLEDTQRQKSLQGFISEVLECVKKQIPVRGYFVWSLLDNFEWNEGYKPRFGLVHVDYTTRTRTWKKSALLYKEIIATHKG